MNTGAGAKSSGKTSGTKAAPGNGTATGTRPRPNAVVRARKAKRSSSGWWIAALAGVVAIGVGAVALSGGGSSSSPSGASGKTIDGIQCSGSEQLAFHDHAHLAVYVDGQPLTVPAGIGFGPNNSCLYWLHSHTPDGVIHMESPVQRTFTLGNYFDIWGKALGPNQVGNDKGTVTAFVDGKQVSGNPRNIKLGEHVNVQLDVGKVVPFKQYSYGSGL